MKDSSRRSKSVFHPRENLWSDVESDSSSENEEKNIKSDPSHDDSIPTSPCCLICSILPNLSHINTCSNHLQLLHRSSLRPTQVVYMMHPPITQCPCQRKSKHRRRSMSSSSSESESQSRRKKRPMTIQSSVRPMRKKRNLLHTDFFLSWRVRAVKMNSSFLRLFHFNLNLMVDYHLHFHHRQRFKLIEIIRNF